MAKVIFKIMESKIDREGTEYRNEIMAGKRQGGIPMDREKMGVLVKKETLALADVIQSEKSAEREHRNEH